MFQTALSGQETRDRASTYTCINAGKGKPRDKCDTVTMVAASYDFTVIALSRLGGLNSSGGKSNRMLRSQMSRAHAALNAYRTSRSPRRPCSGSNGEHHNPEENQSQCRTRSARSEDVPAMCRVAAIPPHVRRGPSRALESARGTSDVNFTTHLRCAQNYAEQDYIPFVFTLRKSVEIQRTKVKQ